MCIGFKLKVEKIVKNFKVVFIKKKVLKDAVPEQRNSLDSPKDKKKSLRLIAT